MTTELVTIKEYRIQKQGLRGMVVSLPKVWLDRLSLKDGDTLTFMQAPGSNDLVIRAIKARKVS